MKRCLLWRGLKSKKPSESHCFEPNKTNYCYNVGIIYDIPDPAMKT